jgi:hypothetical protein
MANVNDQVTKLLSAVTVDGAGSSFEMPRGEAQHAFMATIAGTGAVSATVTIEGSMDSVSWVPGLATMSLTGTTTDVKGATLANAPYPQLRARIASISGTGATVNAWMAI